jgi:hypothetical protein
VGLFVNGGIGIDCSIALFVKANGESSDIPYDTKNIYENIDSRIVDRLAFIGEYGGGIKLSRCIFAISSSRKLLKDNIFSIIPNSKVSISFALMLE